MPKLLLSAQRQVITPNGRSVADLAIDELANVIESVVTPPVATERTSFTLSDYPQTSGGRSATLNVGPLEIAYFPRRPIEILANGAMRSSNLVRVVNAAPGTLFPENGESYAAVLGDRRRIIAAHKSLQFDDVRSSYVLTPVISRLGTLDLRLLSQAHLRGIRKLAITRMRNKSATLNKRHRSSELTRLVFQRIVKRHELNARTTTNPQNGQPVRDTH